MATKTKTRARQGASRLVATMVVTLPPGDHTDPATPGLQLRVRGKGAVDPTGNHAEFSRTWLLRYRWRDEWVRIVLGHAPGMSLAEARERALELRKAIDNGIDPRRARPRRRAVPAAVPTSSATARPDDKHSVEFLVSEFVERYLRPTRKRPEYAEAILAKDVLPKWKGRDARTVEPGEVVELLDGIIDRGSRVMANRTAALLSQLFRFGIQRRIVTGHSPVQLLYRPGGKEKPRKRILTEDELRTFLSDPQDCTRYERLARVMTVLLLTGQRRGELTLARWREIDFAAKTWEIPDENAKTGHGHVVPLTDWAIEELQALQRESEGSAWVLPAADRKQYLDPKQLTRALAKCQNRFKERGFAPFTLHDLRRTCRTGLSALKVEPHIAERVLNHYQDTYDKHAYLDEKRAALEKWATHLKQLRKS